MKGIFKNKEAILSLTEPLSSMSKLFKIAEDNKEEFRFKILCPDDDTILITYLTKDNTLNSIYEVKTNDIFDMYEKNVDEIGIWHSALFIDVLKKYAN